MHAAAGQQPGAIRPEAEIKHLDFTPSAELDAVGVHNALHVVQALDESPVMAMTQLIALAVHSHVSLNKPGHEHNIAGLTQFIGDAFLYTSFVHRQDM